MLMKTIHLPAIAIAVIIAATPLAHGQTLPIPESVIRSAFDGRGGAFVIIDCSSGATGDFRPDASSEQLAPCSTFKIWNTVIGLENGVISAADEAGTYTLGWFAGFVESDGKTYAFACTAKGGRVMGKDARAIVDNVLVKQGFL